ncbi:hypothetical protein PMAYCL1PPCAC_13586, partial [Pristionchus mayeri]
LIVFGVCAFEEETVNLLPVIPLMALRLLLCRRTRTTAIMAPITKTDPTKPHTTSIHTTFDIEPEYTI